MSLLLCLCIWILDRFPGMYLPYPFNLATFLACGLSRGIIAFDLFTFCPEIILYCKMFSVVSYSRKSLWKHGKKWCPVLFSLLALDLEFSQRILRPSKFPTLPWKSRCNSVWSHWPSIFPLDGLAHGHKTLTSQVWNVIGVSGDNNIKHFGCWTLFPRLDILKHT